jgi:hypothetical protein
VPAGGCADSARSGGGTRALTAQRPCTQWRTPARPRPPAGRAGGRALPPPPFPRSYQVDTPRPSPRTNRTRRVPHPVLIGHAGRAGGTRRRVTFTPRIVKDCAGRARRSASTVLPTGPPREHKAPEIAQNSAKQRIDRAVSQARRGSCVGKKRHLHPPRRELELLVPHGPCRRRRARRRGCVK